MRALTTIIANEMVSTAKRFRGNCDLDIVTFLGVRLQKKYIISYGLKKTFPSYYIYRLDWFMLGPALLQFTKVEVHVMSSRFSSIAVIYFMDFVIHILKSKPYKNLI